VAFIQLNRRFLEWQDGELSDPDVISMFGLSDGLSWDDLLGKRRAVLLAEAGSGKTEEMKAQARRQAEAGRFAFYATVQDVGREGLERALRTADRVRLVAWRESGEPAWFFIDSVDEAKLDGVRLERALGQIADGIHGAEGRAHVLLSARYTDWEFRRDLARLNVELPIPHEQVMPPAPTADELVIKTIRHERAPEPQPSTERALVVVMRSLDAERVRAFADGKGARNIDAFIAQIEAGNLWRFARRPLDLDWLVEFWRSHNRLGSLAEMLETSLKERLQETNPDRARRDPLDRVRAFHALERIGAALVFGRNTIIAIPDSEIALSGGNPPLDLADVLPDWSADDRTLLLARPVFDPATFGRARLHNDNEGIVRAFLTARWLARLSKENLSRRDLFGLLFAETYGVKLVKPSIRETAAWLSLWDEAVAQEVMRREPFLLLTAGDPARLPGAFRCALLEQVVARITCQGDRVPLLDLDSLKRFSKPDIVGTVRSLWSAHRDVKDIRNLALRLIWLGDLKDCADLAMEAAFAHPDEHTQSCAGRALMAAGDDAAKQRYAAYIRDNCAGLPSSVVWDAVDGLFPRHLDVDTLLSILSRADITDRGSGLGFQWHGPRLIERVESCTELERLLAGLLQQLGGTVGNLDYPLDDREEAYFPAIAAAGHRLLARSPEHDAPTIAIDAALRLRQHRRARTSLREATGDLVAELHRTPARRRLAFWRAAERFTANPNLQGRAIESVWVMELLGYSPGLLIEDLDWLLADAPTRTAEHQRRLAMDAAMTIWRRNGSSADLLARIEAVARADTVMAQAYDAWIRPPAPSAELRRSERELRMAQRRNAIAQARRDRSWSDFVAELRQHPERLRRLRPTDSEGVDSRLFHLWHLLNAALGSQARYAIETVAPLEPMLGAELAGAVRDGIIAHWRAWAPRPKSAREPDKRNQIGSLDCMGVAGVTLESKTRPDWAERLTADEARRAVTYATLEINGFPEWLADLTRAKPVEVLSVLRAEVEVEVRNAEPDRRCEVLDDLTRADARTQHLLALPLLEMLEGRNDLPPLVLSPILEVVSRSHGVHRERFVRLALDRFNRASDPGIAGHYLGALVTVDAETAARALLAKIQTLSGADRTTLATCLLPRVFGDHFSSEIRPVLAFATLETLVQIAYATIRVEEDHNRPSGVVFSHDARDDAEGARSAAFKLLAETPGRATFEALDRFAQIAGFPVAPARLRELARERAGMDSESAPWPPGEVLAMENEFGSAPRTAIDLQRVVIRRLADIQHDLLHGDFAQGSTLACLPDEKAVQNWVAERLRLMQGRSYSVEREPHVAGEKEPDVRLRAKETDANVAMEIKVAESWTLEQLEAALRDQLCGRYLRSREGRHGVLLLVHQDARARGWTNAQTGETLNFAQVVAHLCAQAAAITATPEGPQPEIAVLDVSACRVADEPVSLVERKRARRGKRAAPRTASSAAHKKVATGLKS
jgi:hypothetical protein